MKTYDNSKKHTSKEEVVDAKKINKKKAKAVLTTDKASTDKEEKSDVDEYLNCVN